MVKLKRHIRATEYIALDCWVVSCLYLCCEGVLLSELALSAGDVLVTPKLTAQAKQEVAQFTRVIWTTNNILAVGSG